MSAQTLEFSTTTKNLQAFVWTEERSKAAVSLATGSTKQEAADTAGVDRTTIYEWLKHPDFAAEVDRLSLMAGIASRAERLRLAMSVVRSRIKEEVLQSDRDALDWLKFAQSETDGVKIDLTKLAAIAEDEASLAHRGPDRLPSAAEAEDTGTDSA